MANPRKFSEKIALHTQKQAEETAAFEAILQEVNSATRDPPRYQKQQHIVPTLGTYRAGSLPNVNQISAKQVIDLQATLQQIDDMKQGRTPIGHARHDRQRQQIGPHRRNFPTDKRIDTSPYGSSYHLSPPPDTSWRRAHSDPSLHMNAMGNANNKNYSHPPVTPPSHRRIIEMVGDNAGDGLQLNYWDSKKIGQSRPKSCEVPNINIYPSHEHEVNSAPAPIISVVANNTGSLPDLSVLQFPPPLATPLDQEDPFNTAVSGAAISLSTSSPHHMSMGGLQNQQSPGQRRRQGSGMTLPSPLVLNQIGGTPSQAGMAGMEPCMQQQYMLCLQQRQLQQQQQMRHRSAHSPTSQPYPTPISPLFSPAHQRSLNHNHPVTKPPIPDIVHQHISSSPTGSPTLSSSSQPPFSLSPPVPQVHILNCEDLNNQVSMTQYRNSVSDSNCQSPTSPHSAPSYSPSQSPGVGSNNQVVNSTFGDAFYIQQQHQTNALQHQFEQFNMNPILADSASHNPSILASNGLSLVNTSSSNSIMNSMAIGQHSGDALHYTQAAMLAMSSSDDLFQSHFLGSIDVMAGDHCNNQSTMCSPSHARHLNHHNSLSSHNSGSKIPDIILTGADDMCRLPLDFAKELGNAITVMGDSFDADFLTADEAFKAGLDPLDLEEIQMLTDASLVADPATEDSFKLDRL